MGVTVFRHLPLLALLPAVAVAAPPQQTRDDPMFDDIVTLSGSFVYAKTSTGFRLDASDGTRGTDIDAEGDLGLKKHKLLGRGEATLRPRPRHRVRLLHHFLPLDRVGRATLTRDIDYGDTDYLTGDEVFSNFDLSLVAINYSYSFVRAERVELAAGIGVNIVDYSTRAIVPARPVEEKNDESGAAPVVTFDGAWRFAGRWYAEGRAQWFKIKLSDVRGSFTALDLNVLYRVHRHVMIGAGYTYVDVSVETTEIGNTGRFDMKLGGPQLFLRAGF
jgi:hypothetical protein